MRKFFSGFFLAVFTLSVFAAARFAFGKNGFPLISGWAKESTVVESTVASIAPTAIVAGSETMGSETRESETKGSETEDAAVGSAPMAMEETVSEPIAPSSDAVVVSEAAQDLLIAEADSAIAEADSARAEADSARAEADTAMAEVAVLGSEHGGSGLRTLDTIFDYHGLVDLTELSEGFILDLRYATSNNFTGTKHYEMPLALMQKEVAVMLIEAQKLALEDGFQLRIYDAYRPLSVQESLYQSTPTELKQFVAKPSKNADHCIGIAIDCGLSDMEGNEIAMPSEFDEFNSSAYVDYSGGTKEQRDNRDYLIRVMQSCGFTVYSKEWWHFKGPVPAGAQAEDISFTEFDALRKEAYALQHTPGSAQSDP